MLITYPSGIVATKQDYNLWMRINSKFIIIETVNFKALISYLVPACKRALIMILTFLTVSEMQKLKLFN